MRFVTFASGDHVGLGLRGADGVVDLAAVDNRYPTDLRAVLEAGPDAVSKAKELARDAGASAVLGENDVTLLPPIREPGKIICLGLNYSAHADESSFDKPDYPVLFVRFASSLVGSGQPMILPKCSDEFDYEGELVAVIGARGRHVPKKDALGLVAGYSVFNDGSVRDYQLRTPQWTMGKNFDGTGGFGPDMITVDEIPDGAGGLKLQTRLNGTVMQDANTDDMIFGVAETISLISEGITLEPGDILVMGTPSGVGFARKPPVFMKDGDLCEVEIEGVGLLSNPIQREG